MTIKTTYLFFFFAALSLIGPSIAVGESGIHGILSLAPAIIGVVGGKRAEHMQGEMYREVMYLESQSTDQSNTSNACSAVGFEGKCVITADHCAYEDREHSLFGGVNPDRAFSLAKSTQIRKLGNGDCVIGKPCYKDLAIIKLDKPLPRDRYITQRDLATKHPEGGDKAFIAGYGFNESNEQADGSYVRKGDGTKRYGHSQIQRPIMGAEGDRRRATFGNVIWTSPGPNITDEGDSGGPLFDANHKLAGIASSIILPENPLFPTPPDEDIKNYRPEDIKEAVYAPIADHLDWIRKTAIDLDCGGPVTPQDISERLNEVVMEHFPLSKDPATALSEIPAKELANLKSLLKRRLKDNLKVDAAKPIFIGVVKQNGKLISLGIFDSNLGKRPPLGEITFFYPPTSMAPGIGKGNLPKVNGRGAVDPFAKPPITEPRYEELPPPPVTPPAVKFSPAPRRKASGTTLRL